MKQNDILLNLRLFIFVYLQEETLSLQWVLLFLQFLQLWPKFVKSRTLGTRESLNQTLQSWTILLCIFKTLSLWYSSSNRRLLSSERSCWKCQSNICMDKSIIKGKTVDKIMKSHKSVEAALDLCYHLLYFLRLL